MRTAFTIFLLIGFSFVSSELKGAELPDRETVFIAEPGEQDDLDKLFPDGPPPELYGEPDPAVLRTLDRLPDDRLEDLLNIYSRVGNLTMGQSVAREMLRRDPKNPDALKARDELRIEVRTLDYNSKVAEALLRGEEIKDFDAVASEAGDLNLRREHGRAEHLLTTLRTRYFKDKPFPYLKDLAYTYHGQGQFNKAEALFQSILDDPDATAESKTEAQAGLQDVKIGRMLAAGDAAVKASNGTRALDLANRLLKLNPADPDAKVLKSRALSVLGRHDEAIDILLAMRGRQGGYFPQLRDLAYAYYEAGRIDESEQAFIELLNSPGHSDEARRDAMRSLADYRRDRLLKEGALALKIRDITLAEVIADELLSAEPNHPDVLIFQAELLMATRQPQEAKEILLTVRDRHFQGTSFPAQGSLGYAFYQTGDIFEARDAFAQLLEKPDPYPVDEVADAMDQWLVLDYFVSPSLSVDFGYVNESEGQGYHIETRYQTAIRNSTRFFVEAETDIIRLSEDSPIGKRSNERYSTRFGAERLFGQGHFVRGYIGASYNGAHESDFLAGLGIGKYANRGIGWSLLGHYNAPARDGLTLEYLDGREHRIEFNIEVPISHRLYFEGQAFVDQIDVDGTKAGRGFGAEVALDYTLIEERLRRPHVSIAYVGIYREFNSEELGGGTRRALGLSPALAQDFVDNIIDPLEHRHGARLTISKRFPKHLEIYGAAGLFYAFDEESVVYNFSGGFNKWVNDRVKIFVEGFYDSSGQGASSGAGVYGVQAGAAIKF